MKKIILKFAFALGLLFFTHEGIAQTKTNNLVTGTVANESIFLDASSFNGAANNIGKGLLFPRVDLSTFTFVTVTTSSTKFPSAYDGMIVYNTGTGNTVSGTVVAVTPGFYYYSNLGATTNSSTGTWKRIAEGNNATTYTGSTSVVLNGTSFERAALTGDVTSAANSNTTTISNNAVTISKLPAGATATTFLRGDGTWVTPTGTSYTGSTSVALNGTSFERAALTGDVTSAANSNATTIANNAVTSAKIADGTIVAADLNQMAATSGQVLKWNGTAWAPAADIDTNTAYAAGTGLTLTGTTFSVNNLAGDVTGTPSANVIANNAVTIPKLPAGATATTFLRGDGTWVTPTGTSYTGSTSVALNGTSFERAALTGDVTSAVNSNTTTIANNAVTIPKLPAGATATTFLRGDGTWVTPIDTNTAYIAGTGLTLTGTTFSVNNLAGDVTGAPGTNVIANNAVTSAKILDGTIATADIANNAVTVAKLPTGATATTFLRGDGTWVTPTTTIVSAISRKTAAYTATANDHTILCDTTTAGFTLTLPAAPATGTELIIRKTDETNNILTFSTSLKISEITSINSVNYLSTTHIQYDGTSWWIINN